MQLPPEGMPTILTIGGVFVNEGGLAFKRPPVLPFDHEVSIRVIVGKGEVGKDEM
jgi:hypothetical protein